MSKGVVLCMISLVLTLYGEASYATGPKGGKKSGAELSSDIKDVRPLQSVQFSKNPASASNQSSDTVAKTHTMSPVSERRAEVQNTIKQLIIFSQRASSDIRREIIKIKAQKGKRIKNADIKIALDVAAKFDEFTLLQKQNEKSLTDNEQDVDRTLQTMTDISQQLQLQLQDAMNKQQQTMQVLSNIMKNQHDTLKSIIQNLK